MSTGNYSKHATVWESYSGDRSAEVDFWGRLAGCYGRHVLAAMCATGKVAAELAVRGFEVTGVDITQEMVAEGRRRHGDVRGLTFIEGDLRTLDLSHSVYDFAFVGTSSFHHLQNAAERVAALRNLSGYTRPGGGLGLELWFPAEKSWQTPWRDFEPLTPPDDSSIRTWKRGRTEYDASRQVVTISQEVFIERDGASERFPHAFRMQLFGRETLEAELAGAGYRMATEYGSYELDVWSPGAPKWLVEAVRE